MRLVEGNSIRAIVRMTGASKNRIVKLLEDAGEAFSAYSQVPTRAAVEVASAQAAERNPILIR